MQKIVRQKMFYDASNQVFENARVLRNNQTEAEAILWDTLKDYKSKGFKFRRQHPIGNYIVDFYCHKKKLIIEVDGKYHEDKDQRQQDNYRTEFFEENDLHIIRFTNDHIINNLIEVLKIIDEHL